MTKASTTKRRPTPAELALLQALWRRGPSTVRELHDSLPEDRQTGYTTVLKLMQIMYDKGLVTRDESRRAHVYSATKSKRETQRQLLNDFIDRVYEGAATTLAVQALNQTDTINDDDAARLRRSLDELENRLV
ncbi:MAG TPA: BlaI/MecI/CopY family transcriptional regulator [Gammaproteobacteria bacterium]|nr:BlaI/MecI/CopY family transcriptional regulator [Gammaproteobacteria bacterium]